MTVLHFDTRPSPARGWDIRFRVAATTLACLAILWVHPAGLLLWTLATSAALVAARLTLREVLRLLGGLSFFLVFLFLVGWVSTPTLATAVDLGCQAWRWILLLLWGQFLYATATPDETVDGLRWYLGFLGQRRAWLAANMAVWALASVPLLLDQAQSLLDSSALRGLRLRRRPWTAFRIVTLGLLIRTLETTGHLTEALEVRGFGAAVPPRASKARWLDAVWLAAVVVWAVATQRLDAILAP